MQQAGGDMMVGSASGSGSSPSPSHLAEPRKGAAARAAGSRIGAEMSSAVGRKRYYEVAPLIAPVPQLSVLEMRVIASVEAQLGERLREDGPILGVEFDPLPPGAFGAPIGITLNLLPWSMHLLVFEIGISISSMIMKE